MIQTPYLFSSPGAVVVHPPHTPPTLPAGEEGQKVWDVPRIVGQLILHRVLMRGCGLPAVVRPRRSVDLTSIAHCPLKYGGRLLGINAIKHRINSNGNREFVLHHTQ